MKKHYLLFLLLIITQFIHSFAQSNSSGRTTISSNEAGFLSEIRLIKPSVKGNSYLNDVWNQGIIYLNPNDNGTELAAVRYDIGNNLIEIKDDSKEEVKALNVERVYMLKYEDAILGDDIVLINSKLISNKVASCLLEQIVKLPEVSLYKRYFTELLKSNYIPEFDAGEREDKIVLKEQFFIYFDNKAYEVPNRKKKFVNIFQGTQQDRILTKIRADNLNLTSTKDLKEITVFINDLFEVK